MLPALEHPQCFARAKLTAFNTLHSVTHLVRNGTTTHAHLKFWKQGTEPQCPEQETLPGGLRIWVRIGGGARRGRTSHLGRVLHRVG